MKSEESKSRYPVFFIKRSTRRNFAADKPIDLCYIAYIRLETMNGSEAVQILRRKLQEEYRAASVSFKFWCDGAISWGGSPEVM